MLNPCHDSMGKTSLVVVAVQGAPRLSIITVWVNNLLLFTMTINLINKMKLDIKAEWEVTDLGELSKIVGIEITMGKDSITIL